jgi:hypothetical protein
MLKCINPDCHNTAGTSCSVCAGENYCQKLDWRVHKSLRPVLKKLPSELQPSHEGTFTLTGMDGVRSDMVQDILSEKYMKDNPLKLLQPILKTNRNDSEYSDVSYQDIMESDRSPSKLPVLKDHLTSPTNSGSPINFHESISPLSQPSAFTGFNGDLSKSPLVSNKSLFTPPKLKLSIETEHPKQVSLNSDTDHLKRTTQSPRDILTEEIDTPIHNPHQNRDNFASSVHSLAISATLAKLPPRPSSTKKKTQKITNMKLLLNNVAFHLENVKK